MYLPEETSVNRKVKNRITKLVVLFIVLALITASIFTIYLSAKAPRGIVDSKGEKVETQIISIEQVSENGVQKLSFKQNSMTDIVLPEGKYNIELKPKNVPVVSVKIYGADVKDTIDLRIDDVPETGDYAKWEEVYAIDPTSIEFRNATVTAVAKGTELWKCKEWNFKQQKCLGEWQKLMDIVPGEYYSFVLTKDDPGLAELGGTFSETWESGSFATNGWTDSGTGTSWIVSSTGCYAGTKCAFGQPKGGTRYIETSVNTTGYRAINLSYYRADNGLDAGEFCGADYYDGTTWVQVDSAITGSTYVFRKYSLPSSADNKSNFKIRFKVSASSNNENCYIDNVQVVGQIIPLNTNITINGTIVNADNQEMNTTIEIVKDSVLVYNKTANAHAIHLAKGKYNLTIKPKSSKLKKILIKDANFTNNNQKIVELDSPPDNSGFNDIYAIDTLISFKSANLTVSTSSGSRRLYKCANWDFKSRTCSGSWVLAGKISGSEYVIPISQGDPAYGEVNATNALHLDSSYRFISNIFEQIKLKDDVWSETINSGHFVRVTYQKNLTNNNVIDVYVKKKTSDASFVVYPVGSTSPSIGNSGKINSSTGQLIYIPLENVTYSFDTVDFKISGGDVEFDYIHDPYVLPPMTNDVTDSPDPVVKGSSVTITANVTDDDSNISRVWVRIDGINYTMTNYTKDLYRYIYNTASLANGLHNYTVYANDTTAEQSDPWYSNFTVMSKASILETADYGAVSGTYNAVTGTYLDTRTDNNVYYGLQSVQTGGASGKDLVGNMSLRYDLSAYNKSQIAILEGNLTYCHAKSNANGCAGGNPAEGVATTMHIFIYNASGSRWQILTTIPKTANNLESTIGWRLTSNIASYINNSGWLWMRFEYNLNDGASAFLNDYSPLWLGEGVGPVIHSVTPAPNPGVQDNTVTITANVTDNVKVDTLRFSVRLPNGSIVSQKLYQTWLFDGFDDGNSVEYAINYSNPANPGVWSVKANKVYQETASPPDIMFSYRKNEVFDDFTYSTQIRTTEAYAAGKSVGIIFRWVSYGNYYLMDHYSGNLRLIRFQNNLPTVLNTTAYTLTGSTWYNFKVKFVKNKIETYVNDVLVMKGTDSTFASGSVGFRLMDYSGEFDNLTVMRGNEIYKLPFNMTKLSGTYNYTLYANDTSSNEASSKSGYFLIFSQADVPKVKIILPSTGSNFNQNALINFSVNATDPDGISSVKLNITYGTTTNSLTLTDPNVDGIYTGSFSSTSFVGTYTVRALVTDTKGIYNRSQTITFNTIDNTPPTINLIWDIPDPDVQYQPVYLYANVTDNNIVKTVEFEVTMPNGTKNNFTGTKLLRYDNYQNNNVSDYQTAYSNPSYPGTWAVVNLGGNLVYRQSQADFAQYFSTIKGQNYTDLEMSGMVRAIDAIEAGKSMGFVFRYQNKTNYYLFDNYNAQFRLVKVVNNTNTVLATASGTITINNWYNFSVYAVGNQLRGYVNGVQKVNASDNSIHIGTAGYRLQDYQGEFDNLTIYDRRPIYRHKYNTTSAIGLYSYKVFAEDMNSLKSISSPGTFLVAGAVVGTLKVESGENPLFTDMITSDITQLNINNAASVSINRVSSMKARFTDVNSTLPIIGIGKVEIIVHYSSQANTAGGMTIEGREASQLGEKWCNKTVSVATGEATTMLKCDDRHIFTEDDLNNLVLIVKNNQANKRLNIEYVLVNYTYAVEDEFSVRINTPKNKVYNGSTVPLSFSTFDGTVSSCKYSLNKGANISITNTTTAYLSGFEGTNNVTVYCMNTLGAAAKDSVEFVMGKTRTLHPLTASKSGSFVTFDLFSIDNIYTQLAANEFINVTRIEGIVPDYAAMISSARAYCYVREASNGARLYFRLKSPLGNYTPNICYGTTNQQGYIGCDLRNYNISSVDELNNLTFSCHVTDADGGLPAIAKIDEAFVNVTTGLRPITLNATINLSSKFLSKGVTLSATTCGLAPSTNSIADIKLHFSTSVSGYPKTLMANSTGCIADSWTVPQNIVLGDYAYGVNQSNYYAFKTFAVLNKHNVSGTVKNSTGALIPATIKLYYENMTQISSSTDSYNLQLDYGRNYVINITPTNHKVKSVFVKGVKNVGDMNDAFKLGKLNNTLFSIQPRMKFTNATVTVSSGLPAGSFGYVDKCSNWDFLARTCAGNWTRFAGIGADTYTFLLTQGDPGFLEGVSTCVAEDSTAKGAWSSACDGTYPRACGSGLDLLKCNDGLYESQTATSTKYGGVRIKQYNASITNCARISTVILCRERWTSGSPTDCAVKVDANGGASWSTVTTTCPGGTANPGVTCVDVSSLESWTCSNFFGASGTRAEAFAELSVTQGSTKNVYTDVLYFNVTYQLTDTTAPTWVQTPTDRTIEYGSSVYYDLNATDNVAVDKYLINDSTNFKINALTGILENNVALALKTYWLKLRVNDTMNNNLTTNIKVIVQDTTNPAWTQLPTDRMITQGSSLYYDLNATDNYLLDKYSVNDTVSFKINALTGVLENNVVLAAKIYSLQLKVNDTKSNSITRNILVTVQASEEPGLVMEWIDPDKEETDRQMNEAGEVQTKDQDVSFVQKVFGSIFGMFAD